MTLTVFRATGKMSKLNGAGLEVAGSGIYSSFVQTARPVIAQRNPKAAKS